MSTAKRVEWGDNGRGVLATAVNGVAVWVFPDFSWTALRPNPFGESEERGKAADTESAKRAALRAARKLEGGK